MILSYILKSLDISSDFSTYFFMPCSDLELLPTVVIDDLGKNCATAEPNFNK
jgi:hypothetical protein